MLAVGGAIIVVVIPEKRSELRLNVPFAWVDSTFGVVASGLLFFNEAAGFFLPMLPKNFR